MQRLGPAGFAARWQKSAEAHRALCARVRQAFLQRATTTDRVSWRKKLMHSALKMANYSDFDVNGILNTYPLHLMSTAQLSALFREADGAPSRRV